MPTLTSRMAARPRDLLQIPKVLWINLIISESGNISAWKTLLSNLKTETKCFSETSANFKQTALSYNSIPRFWQIYGFSVSLNMKNYSSEFCLSLRSSVCVYVGLWICTSMCVCMYVHHASAWTDFISIRYLSVSPHYMSWPTNIKILAPEIKFPYGTAKAIISIFWETTRTVWIKFMEMSPLLKLHRLWLRENDGKQFLDSFSIKLNKF